jgi:dienelactone hydrolase
MKTLLTRRELGFTALAGAAVVGSAETVNDNLDPVVWTHEQYQHESLKLTFRASRRDEVEPWQRAFRTKLVELLGGFPTRTPLNARMLPAQQLPGYTRQRFFFSSRPGVSVTGYLLLPANARKPMPVVICVPGHGRGVDDIVGIDEQGQNRSGKPGYQHDFAIQVVEHGMAAVAIEPMGFGYRRDPLNKEKGVTTSACQPAAGSALLLGQTMIGWRVWDVMRTIDWIETQPQLNKARIGCMGISGGGTCTQFSSALDTRIKAAFISGYLNTFHDSIMSISHCIDNYVPGILSWGESYDVAALIAPRPLFSEGGKQDPIFPVHATIASFQKVKKVYELCGEPDKAQQEIFEGEHEFHGRNGLPFLREALA